MCPTGILSTCRHIYHEASNVLYRLHSAKFNVNRKAGAFGYQLQDIDAAPFIGFRQLDITTNGNSRWLYIEYGKGKKGSLGYMLSNWADMLFAALQSTDPAISRTINLMFRLDDWSFDDEGKLYEEEDEIDEYSAKACWFRVQAASAVQEMRQDLQSRLLAIALTATSNVEASYPFVSVQRHSAYSISIDNSMQVGQKVGVKMINCKSQALEFDLHLADRDD